MAYIVIEKATPKDSGKRIPLDENSLLIGRVTIGNTPDVPLSDEYISRHHAEICFAQNCYSIRDLNSTNGTSIDDVRLEPGKFYPLKDDSLIGLGITPSGPRILLRFKQSPTVPTTPVNEGLLAENAAIRWLRVDESKGEIWVDGKPLILPRKEYDLIVCLYKRMGQVCPRDEIIAQVWPEVVNLEGVTDAALDQLIHRLRLKIEADPSQPTRLISRKGFGYMLT